MFITENELYTAIHQQYIDEITREDVVIVPAAIEAALAEMRGYLQNKFDVATIFNTTGYPRHPLLVQFAKDITVYNLIELDKPGIDNEDRRARYKRAIKWLEDVRDELIITELPKISPADIKVQTIYYASKPKKDNYF
jgi:phage gp36-like protein